jgi:hypothetical protein
MTYESTAVHGVVLDLCHVLGLNHENVSALHIHPGYIHAELRYEVKRDETKDVAYSYPVGS